MTVKRKQPQSEGEDEEQNEQLRGNQQQQPQEVVLVGGVSCSAASLRAIRKPFKPPMASRPEANGRSVQVGLNFSRLALLGPGGLLQVAVTKAVTIGRRLGEGLADDTDAPDVLLFDPVEFPGLPPLPEGQAYVRVLVDKFIAGKLRPHQVEGVQFMFKCLAGLKDPEFRGCIQSDSMGLGKTLQSICCLWTLLTSGITGRPTCTRALVITPTSLVANWGVPLASMPRRAGREVDKWLGGRIKPAVIEDATQLKKELARLGGYVPLGRSSAVVLIMSYDVFRLNQAAVYAKKFELVICDEAHRLKNGQSKINQAINGLSCRLRLLLTGTPIQNDLSEFYAMFNTACPHLFGTPADFRKNYENPILAGRDANATDKQLENGTKAQQALVSKAQQYMIRRTSEALKQYLPAKVQEVIFCKMSALQNSLYRGFLISEPVQAALEGCKLERERALATLPAINALKKLCCHPDMIWDLQRSTSGSETSQRPTTARASGRAKASGKAKASDGGGEAHAVVTGMEGLEPLFRGQEIYPAYVPGGVQAMHSGKMQVLVSLLKGIREGEAGDKVVLVSNYTESLALCDKVCKANRWATLSLTGDLDARKRQARVDEFNSPAHPSFVLLLSSKAGGCGLNIIGANRLVLLDPSWNPADDQQAMGRVWREGQKKDVYIYRLLTTGSIEEKIFQRQLAKEGLSRVVVDDNADEQRTFSKDELKALFRVDPQIQCDTHIAIKCTCGGKWPRPEEKQQQQQHKEEEKEPEPEAVAEEEEVPWRREGREERWDFDDDFQDDGGAKPGSSCEGKKGKQPKEPPPAEAKAPALVKAPVKQPSPPPAAVATNPGSVLSWAHVKDVTLLPDRVWQHVSAPIRNAYITFAFSDFNLEEKLQPENGNADDEDDGDSIDREAAAREDIDPEDWEGQEDEGQEDGVGGSGSGSDDDDWQGRSKPVK